ncbi:MAG TPA: CoA transferase [Gammaproteobacteria bacterium]|nr:CoA transferase [Gammaproteobacteria bacterium]
MTQAEQSLAGIMVLDLGQIYNGPYATFLMAMAGARVIKVESLVGEKLRGRGANSSAAYAFLMLNQNKESISLNLKSDRGREIFNQLVEKADVVLENFSPDTMSNLGLSAEKLLEINPRLIYAAGSGYGRSGLHRDFLAMDLTVQAMSGIMSVTGFAGSPPLKAGVALCDFFGGIHLYGAVITKLFERERTGKGAIVDVAMQDSVVPTLATVFGAYYYLDQQVQERTDNRHPALSMAPYNVYAASDGHVSIICVRDGHWRGLLKAIGRDDLLDDEGLKTMAQRSERMSEVDDIVGTWTLKHTKHDVLLALQAEGVPSAMVRDVEEVLGDQHMHDRGMMRDIEHPVFGDVTLLNSPLNVATGSAVEPRLPPGLGEHNELVYGELGITTEEMQQLIVDGVIGEKE